MMLLLDITQASYVILEGTYGHSTDDSFSIQIIRVPYDIERAIGQAEAAQMPDFQAYADELRTSRYRGATARAAATAHSPLVAAE